MTMGIKRPWGSHDCGDHMTAVMTTFEDLVQVIEKALKKLKLDAMIIQQGRLSDNKASVNKDDLLSMVRYGAEMVFSGGGGTITDEDIDAIIAKVICCSQLSPFTRDVMSTTM